MIDALRYMGLERASQYKEEMFKGFPLIGKEKRTTDNKLWQKKIDGWWIYVNMSNERKIVCIKGVAKMLNIPLKIIPNEDVVPVPEPNEKQKHRRALFSLNGTLSLPKNRSVWATVKKFVEEMPSATFEEIQYQFPASLQGSYGVVRSVEDIKKRQLYNRTEASRWFLDADEILTAADGVRFVVSSEWGDNFSAFQQHIKNDLGWTLEEV